MTEAEFLTIPQLQQYLQISRAFAYRLTQTGVIPRHKIGRCVRVRRADADAYLELCRR